MSRRTLAVLLGLLLALVRPAGAGTQGGSGSPWPDLSSPAPPTGDGARDAALLLAVEDYVHLPDLPGATNNLLAWQVWLTRTRGVDPAHVRVLRDGAVTREAVLAAAAAVAHDAPTGGTLWVLWVGHSVQVPEVSDTLLLGADSPATPDGIRDRGVGVGALERVLLAGAQAHTVGVYDTSPGWGGGEQGLLPGLQPVVPLAAPTDPRVTRLQAGDGAAPAGMLPTSEGAGARPAFSYLLLGGLRGWADVDHDDRVDTEEAAAWVRTALARTAPGAPVRTVSTGPSLSVSSAGERGPDLSAGLNPPTTAAATASPSRADCSDPRSLEASAWMGALTAEQTRCAEARASGKDVATALVFSRLLVAQAEAVGDRETWERLVRRHLETLDATDAGLAAAYAMRRWRTLPSVGAAEAEARRAEVRRWTEVALAQPEKAGRAVPALTRIAAEVGATVPDAGSGGPRRHPRLDAPSRVSPGVPFEVLVQLTMTPHNPVVDAAGLAAPEAVARGAVALDGTTTTDGKLDLGLAPAAGGWALDVVLDAPGCTIEGGLQLRRIHLPAAGDSEEARFRLVAGAAPPEGSLRIGASLYADGRYLGRISRVLAVPVPPSAAAPVARAASAASAASASASPLPATTSVAERPGEGVGLSLAPRPHPPDLQVQVYTRGRDGTALVQLVSPGAQLDVREVPYPRAAALAEWLGPRLHALAGEARGLVPVPAGLVARARVEELGRELWERFVPEAFQDRLWWELRRNPGLRTLQILTDDPALPWELARPHRSVDGVEEDLGFLAARFEVARWPLHYGNDARLRATPPLVIPAVPVAVIAPAYQGRRSLPHQAEEVAYLSGLPGFHALSGGEAAVAEALAAGVPGILHFAGHGEARVDGGTTTYRLELEDGALDPLGFAGLARRARVAPGLVFLNACDLGQAESELGFTEGWAPAVLDTGASAFIGGLWQLGDASAARFAQAFYERVGQGIRADGRVRIATALREVRAAGYARTGDPTWLAYALYGDPDVELVAAPPAPTGSPRP